MHVSALLLVVCTCAVALWSAAAEASPSEAPEPEWLVRLFPYTGSPDRCENRLRRAAAQEFVREGTVVGSVIVELRYPDVHGEEALGQARLFVPHHLRDDPTSPVPVIHNAGYELDEESGIRLAERGYLVSTPHAHPLNPLGRGVNLDRAILHAVCALPFADRRRVAVQGGSAGGWMTLMLAADTFPLLYSMPDVPPIHWGYNAAYIAENQPIAGPPEGSDEPRMPVLQVVGIIAEQSRVLYNQPFDHPAYLAVSPLQHMATLTAPTLITFSTADMLVPIEQVAHEAVRPHDPSRFPEGFWTKLTSRFPGVRVRRTLFEVLPVSRRSVFTLTPPANIPRLNSDGSAQGAPYPAALPFDRNKPISIVILDEGPKEPDLGHFKYAWALDHEPFRAWAESRGIQKEQLTRAKLERLMKRLRSEPWVPMRIRKSDGGEEFDANQLDYPEAERQDVLLGLEAFAGDDAQARHLAQLYAQLPDRLKVLGSQLGDGSPEGVRQALRTFRAGQGRTTAEDKR